MNLQVEKLPSAKEDEVIKQLNSIKDKQMKNHFTLKLIRKAVTLAGLLAILVFIASGDLLTSRTAAHSRISCDIAAQYNAVWTCGTNWDTAHTDYSTDNGWNHCKNVDYVKDECPTTLPQHEREQCLQISAMTHGAMYDCQNITTITYNDRYFTYSSCLNGSTGMFYDVDLCTPPFDPCPDALAEAASCLARFPISVDYDTDVAREECLDSVPHGRPKGRDNGCPGFPVAP